MVVGGALCNVQVAHLKLCAIQQTKGPMLRTGTAVDAALIAAPSSAKIAEGERVAIEC